MAFRFAVWVRPGARRPSVGGSRLECLVVAVTAPAEGGKANAAVRRAVADAFAVPPRDVTIARGARGREKVIAIDPAPAGADRRLAALRATSPS